MRPVAVDLDICGSQQVFDQSGRRRGCERGRHGMVLGERSNKAARVKRKRSTDSDITGEALHAAHRGMTRVMWNYAVIYNRGCNAKLACRFEPKVFAA